MDPKTSGAGTPWEGVPQPRDEERAGDVWFYKTSYVVIQEGLKALLGELATYDNVVKALDLQASPYERETRRLKQMIEWGEEHLEKADGPFGEVEILGATFGSLRYVKAAILLQVRKREGELSQIIRDRGRVPQSIVRAFGDKVSELRNLAEQGKLNGLRPIELFLELVPVRSAGGRESSSELASSERTYLPVVRQDIPVTDPDLRKRCLDLFSKIDDPNASPSQPQDVLDTVVSEMSRLLEDRIRERCRLSGQSKKDYLSAAFLKKPYGFDFGKGHDFQGKVHELFKGYDGFVRNEVMHELVPTYTRERVIQLLGFVDYLLALLTQAQAGTPETQNDELAGSRPSQ